VAGETVPEQAAQKLLEYCCVERPVDAQGDVGELINEVEAGLMALDPGSEFRFSLACDTCGHQWSETLDIHGLLWEEVDAHARALLIDVHCLARAYGWSETEILALSPQRRATYVQMVNP
jgi:hypothetical protein